MRMSHRIRQYQLKKNLKEIFAVDVGIYSNKWNWFFVLSLKLFSSKLNKNTTFFYKKLWELTSRPWIWAFIDYYKTFLNQDMALERHFYLIGKTEFFS